MATFDNVTVTGNLGINEPVPNGLPAPVGVSVTRATGADLAISWTDQAGETGYRIERSIDGSVFTTAGTVGMDVTSYTDTNLRGTMRYFYRVLALNGSGASVPSTVVSQLNRPSAVRNLEVTSLDQNRIVLDWIETSGETGYRIERSSDGINYTTIGTVGANIPSYTNTGLASGTSYFYRVTPASPLGDGPSTDITGATRLQQVTGLTFTQRTSNQITLGWTDIPTEANYRIQRSTDGTTFTTLATIPLNSTSYIDSTVQPLTEYYYRVLGVNGESVSLYNSLFGATPSATPLLPPWLSADIGTVTGPGAAGLNGTTFTIISGGSAIGGTSDNFRFTYQMLDGDGSITARVASLENTNSSARLGLMIRESAAANSRHVMVSARADNPLQLLYRTNAGGSTTTAADITDAAPVWLRLTRAGNLFNRLPFNRRRHVDSNEPSHRDHGDDRLDRTGGHRDHHDRIEHIDSRQCVGNGRFEKCDRGRPIRVLQSIDKHRLRNGTGNPTTAIDFTKSPMLAGYSATFTNYTNYHLGLNGLLVDVNGLDNATAADFQFATWNGIDVAGFVVTTAVPTITTFVGGGLGGSNRVKIEFPNNAIQNTWLRVTVLASSNTDLFANDVFYFGNAIGETGFGNSGTPEIIRVNATDTSNVRQNQSPGPTQSRSAIDTT